MFVDVCCCCRLSFLLAQSHGLTGGTSSLCRARVMECQALSVLLVVPRVRLWSKLDPNFDADSLGYACEGDS